MLSDPFTKYRARVKALSAGRQSSWAESGYIEHHFDGTFVALWFGWTPCWSCGTKRVWTFILPTQLCNSSLNICRLQIRELEATERFQGSAGREVSASSSTTTQVYWALSPFLHSLGPSFLGTPDFQRMETFHFRDITHSCTHSMFNLLWSGQVKPGQRPCIFVFLGEAGKVFVLPPEKALRRLRGEIGSSAQHQLLMGLKGEPRLGPDHTFRIS